MDAVLDGPEGRPEEALFVPWPPPEERADGGGGQVSASETTPGGGGGGGGGGDAGGSGASWGGTDADATGDWGAFEDGDASAADGQRVAGSTAAAPPAALRTVNPDVPAAHLLFRFVGRLVGMTIASGRTVTLPLAPWIWSAMLGRRGTMQQLESVDEVGLFNC